MVASSEVLLTQSQSSHKKQRRPWDNVEFPVGHVTSYRRSHPNQSALRQTPVSPAHVLDTHTLPAVLCDLGVRLGRTAPEEERGGIFRLAFCAGTRGCEGAYPSPRGQPFQTGPWDGSGLA